MHRHALTKIILSALRVQKIHMCPYQIPHPPPPLQKSDDLRKGNKNFGKIHARPPKKSQTREAP